MSGGGTAGSALSAVILTILWTAFFVVWYLIGIPLVPVIWPF